MRTGNLIKVAAATGDWLYTAAASLVIKVGNRKLQFSDRLLQICDEADMDAQNFNFSPRFFHNGGFLFRNFVFLIKISDKKTIFNRLKFRGRGG